MKPILAAFWKRRGCRSLLWIALVLGLAFLHPYPRQTLFGPQIDGVPLCIWEREARIAADPEGYRQIWMVRLLETLGIPSGRYFSDNVWRDEAAIPVLLALLDEPDVKFRRFALENLDSARVRDQADALPYLQRHLQDDDPKCRFIAAFTLWRWKKEPAAMATMVALLDCDDSRIRSELAFAMGYFSGDSPAAFRALEKLCHDSDPGVRMRAESEMQGPMIRSRLIQEQSKKKPNQEE